MPDAFLLQRLKERKLVQWAVAYLAGAWVLFEVSDVVGGRFGVPDVALQALFVVLAFGFFATMVLAWYHGEKGRQRVSGPELLMIASLLVIAAGVLATLGPADDTFDPRLYPVEDDGRPSIAAIPFVNRSGLEDDLYFTDGIHDGILTHLSKVGGLRVTARQSVQQYRDSEKTMKEIASELGVRYVLEAGLLRAGEQIRLNVQLIDAATDDHIWAEEYDRPMSVGNLLDVQSELTLEIVNAIGAALGPGEQERIEARPTEDGEAYDLYLRGRYLMDTRTEEGLRAAVGLFEAAVVSDPGYAAAYAGLADSYLLLKLYGFMLREEAVPRARPAAVRALELDDHLAEAHNSLALLLWYEERDWVAAEREYRRAIELNPNYVTAHAWYAEFLIAAGRMDEGVAQMRQARALDPVGVVVAAFMGRRLYYARRYDEALEHIRVAAELEPTYEFSRVWAALVLSKLGRAEEGLAELQESLRLPEPSPILRAATAYLYSILGQTEDAVREVRQLEGEAGGAELVPYWMAVAHAGLGDRDRAFQWLERAVRGHDGWSMSLHVDPSLDSLRDDPRFEALVREIGLVP